jgi:hypothetical protein
MAKSTKKPTRKVVKRTVSKPEAAPIGQVKFDQNDYAKMEKLPESQKSDIMVQFAKIALALHEVDFAWEEAQNAWVEARGKLDQKNEAFLREIKAKLESVK